MKSLPSAIISLAGLSTTLQPPVQSTECHSSSSATLQYDISRQAREVIPCTLLVDGILINGKPQALRSGVTPNKSHKHASALPRGSIFARVHAGVSATEIPEEVFHTLYTTMGGALMKGGLKYVVPCTAEAELVFTLGSQNITIHPLDLTDVHFHDFGNGQRLTVCTSSYRPAVNGNDGFIILGDSFLRNVDIVYDPQDYMETESEGSIKSSPIQIVPLTDAKGASTEFKKARAKNLAALPAQIDVLTVNDLARKLSGDVNLDSGSRGTVQARFNARSPEIVLAIGSDSDSNSNLEAALRKLTTIAPTALTLLTLVLAMLIVLIVISTRILDLLKVKESGRSKTGRMTTPLDGRSEGDYRD